MKKVMLVLTFLWALFGTNLVGGDSALTHVTFVPQWVPQAQFAGYMMAFEKGFYKNVGLDVEILRGGPANPPLESLKSGLATFCTAWISTAVQQRAAGIKVVNLAQIVQHSALMLVAKKSSGINILNDLDGRRIGLWQGDFRIQPLALFKMRHLDVIEIPMFSTVNLFLKGGVDAISAMWYNEYHTLLNSGFNKDELTTFFFSDYGLNFPEDGIYCLEKTLNENPKVCESFVQASLKGWIYALDHQDETLDVVMSYADAAHTGTNRAHQVWMLARMKDLIYPNGEKSLLGKLDQKQYELVTKTLQSLQLIDEQPLFTDFYQGRQ
ncbi:MAG: ABC transporter substrate-binding protein [Desulfomonilaceae bacterium]